MAPKALILALAGICVVGGIIGIIVMTSSGEASSGIIVMTSSGEASSEDTGTTDAAGSMTKESRFGMTRLIKMAKEHKLIAAGIATLIVAAGAGTIYLFRKTTSSSRTATTATEISVKVSTDSTTDLEAIDTATATAVSEYGSMNDIDWWCDIIIVYNRI